MFVNSSDEDDQFDLVPARDDSLRYMPESPVIIPRGVPLEKDDGIYFMPIVEKKETSSCNFPPESFMHKVSRSSSPLPNAAQKSAIDAGCSDATINAMKNSLPSQIESIIVGVTEEDKIKLMQQIKKESITVWDSNSIYTGLGVDENGNYVGLSLCRLNDLLCNVNEHLILMRRDMVQHKHAISEARQKGTLQSLGFTNVDNRARLHQISKNIRKSSNDLLSDMGKLMDTIEGKQETKEYSKYTTVGLFVGVSLGVSVLGYYYHK